MVNGKKMYYSISEVCGLTGLEPHVLRYWESEFSQLHPKKNRAGNRAYRDKDIDMIRYIKFLLYDEKFTIPGARKKIADMKDGEWEQLSLNLQQPQQPVQQTLQSPITMDEVKKELIDIITILNG
jgi:DNA-binding transcriptional MerR regulator